MRKVLVLTLLFVFCLSMTAQAKNIWEMADSPKYGEKAGGMILRGLVNAASCFVDIIAGTVNGAKEDSPQVFGAVGGFAKGCVCTILRAASGVTDVATFWIPGFNGFPVCRTYGNCFACNKKVEAPALPPMPMYQEPAPMPVAAAPVHEGRMKYIKK